MKTRRDFIKVSTLGAGAIVVNACSAATPSEENSAVITDRSFRGAKLISTWNHGEQANGKGLEVLKRGGSALDAVVEGVKVVELDPEVRTVGVGGRPDREGKVTLDACVMNYDSKCGAVAAIENITSPVSVARKVMEETPHVILVGNGAYQFAREQGFEHSNLLTKESEEEWYEWLKESKYALVINQENHDTIGMLGIDDKGNLAGACTTSGWAYKMHGRVGDSPIIGAGLYVDNEVGAACATGLGEAVIRACGSFLVVEFMRQGQSPEQACLNALDRIHNMNRDNMDGLQVGFLALDKSGKHGSASMFPGFNYALGTTESNVLIDAPHKLEW